MSELCRQLRVSPRRQSPWVETLGWRRLPRLAQGGRGREGEEGRERGIEPLRDSHSKFIGAKIAARMDLFPFGNYRKLQAPTTVIQIATLDD